MSLRDRADAAQLLAQRLKGEVSSDCLVIGLPRGGAVVGAEVARILDLDFDILVVRKLGHPESEEYGVGAMSEDHGIWLGAAAHQFNLGLQQKFRERVHAEMEELDRRKARYRGLQFRHSVEGREVCVIDDGVATGATAIAACRQLKKEGAAKITFAAGVMPPAAFTELSLHCDEVMSLEIPEEFFAVGQFYESFAHVSDDEVIQAILQLRVQLPPNGAPQAILTTSHQQSSDTSRSALHKFFQEKGLSVMSIRESRTHRLIEDASRWNLLWKWIQQNPELRSLNVAMISFGEAATAGLKAAAEDPLHSPDALICIDSLSGVLGSELVHVVTPTLLGIFTKKDEVVGRNREALAWLPQGQIQMINQWGELSFDSFWNWLRTYFSRYPKLHPKAA